MVTVFEYRTSPVFRCLLFFLEFQEQKSRGYNNLAVEGSSVLHSCGDLFMFYKKCMVQCAQVDWYFFCVIRWPFITQQTLYVLYINILTTYFLSTCPWLESIWYPSFYSYPDSSYFLNAEPTSWKVRRHWKKDLAAAGFKPTPLRKWSCLKWMLYNRAIIYGCVGYGLVG